MLISDSCAVMFGVEGVLKSGLLFESYGMMLLFV